MMSREVILGLMRPLAFLVLLLAPGALAATYDPDIAVWDLVSRSSGPQTRDITWQLSAATDEPVLVTVLLERHVDGAWETLYASTLPQSPGTHGWTYHYAWDLREWGSFDMRVRVDVDDAFHEPDETNNEAHGVLRVSPGPHPGVRLPLTGPS